jgi:sulfhydrogenase subunit beta (sulfur reductase)
VSERWKFLKDDDLAGFLAELAGGAEVWVPKKTNKWDWAPFHPGDAVALAPSIVETSAKKLFFPRRRPIATFDTGSKWSVKPVEPETRPRVVVGMHACDAAALRYLDRVFLESGHKDGLYEAERNRTTIVGYRCDEMKPSCHCTNRGFSPDETAGMDAVLSRTDDGYLVRALSDKGAKLLASKLLEDTDRQPEQKEWRKGEYPVPTPDELMALYDDDFWVEASDICLTCGACTFACPTCSCFLVADEKFEGKGERVTCWDTCQFLSYSREASGHNPRKTNAARLRNRTLDKFAYRHRRYGMNACIGCGRCVLICPINRSFPQLGAKLAERAQQRQKAGV